MAEMAVPVWYTKPVQIAHSVLIQHFYVKAQISAEPLRMPGQILIVDIVFKWLK